MTPVSLERLAADHGPVLILDAAGSAQAALRQGAELRAASAPGEAGVALFQALDGLASPSGSAADLIARAEAFVFCRSPGSVLGIRTCAMAIRVWRVLRARPVYAYDALELLAAANGRADVAFIADARRGEWHWARAGSAPERMPEDQVAARARADGVALAMPEGFRAWSAAPPETRPARYNIGELWSRAAPLPLLSFTSEPDAWMAAEPSYLRWTPRLHGAAGTP
ncbi:MAG TPA: hypothetical protein VFE31_02105 [Opitutaceae bacterium]|nr:hypothetical protein [Opitutaceae bacterium]